MGQSRGTVDAPDIYHTKPAINLYWQARDGSTNWVCVRDGEDAEFVNFEDYPFSKHWPNRNWSLNLDWFTYCLVEAAEQGELF